MKNNVLIIVAIALCILVASSIYIGLTIYGKTHDSDSLAWLRSEFNLDDNQMIHIKRLHEDFHDLCRANCDKVLQAEKQLKQLENAGVRGAQLEDARKKFQNANAECRRAVFEHVREVARAIGGNEGQRYLAIVLPRVSQFDQSKPINLRLN